MRRRARASVLAIAGLLCSSLATPLAIARADDATTSTRDRGRAGLNASAGGSIAEGSATSRGIRSPQISGSAGAFSTAAPVELASWIQSIPTWLFSPASPDPSGIAFLPGATPTQDRLMIADSEVEEATGAGWHGVNLWQLRTNGTLTDTGTTWTGSSSTPPNYTREPTGLGFDPATNTLFVSSDSGNRLFVVRWGPDLDFGTADDLVTTIDAGAYGSGDTEDPEFDPITGHLFFLDGAGTEVYEIDPRSGGQFGDGNDVVTHFDIGQFANDFEALGSDPARGTLLIGGRTTKQIYEVTKSGALVRTIDVSGIPGIRNISGLKMAPGSDGSGRMNYWIVDRQIDNGPNPNENDGMLYEVAASSSDALPIVTLTQPTEGLTVAGTIAVEATVTDDLGVGSVEFLVDGVSIGAGALTQGTATNGVWSGTWTTTTVGDGPHTVSTTATDTIGQTGSDANGVTVENDGAPDVTLTQPAENATVAGTIAVEATVTDDLGVGSVEFLVDGVSIGQGALTQGTATNGVWSGTWTTTTVDDGPHTVSATATDTSLQTGSDANPVTVENQDSLPTVTITSPAEGSFVTGTITLQATATDDFGVSSVEFRVDGVSIGQGALTQGTATNGVWSGTWSPSVDGAHTISAIATDNYVPGQTGTDSNGVTVDRTGPAVAVTAPTGTVTGAATIQATTSDASGVSSVEFFVDGVSIGQGSLTQGTAAGGVWSKPWNSAGVPNGPHDLTATATDGAGLATTSFPSSVFVDNPLIANIPVATGADDAEERALGKMNLTSTDLDLLLDNSTVQVAAGMRFAAINVPQGAEITSAYVQFKADETTADATTLTIWGQDSDDAATFTTVKFNITSPTLRPRTDASQGWSPGSWTKGQAGPDQQTPPLVSIIQEIVSRPGWGPGHAIVLIFTGSGRRVAESYEGLAPPILHLEWE